MYETPSAMSFLITLNDTLQEIVAEVEGMDKLEQKIVLAQLRAKRIAKTFKDPVRAKNVKPLTMAQIDEIKHKARAK